MIPDEEKIEEWLYTLEVILPLWLKRAKGNFINPKAIYTPSTEPFPEDEKPKKSQAQHHFTDRQRKAEAKANREKFTDKHVEAMKERIDYWRTTEDASTNYKIGLLHVLPRLCENIIKNQGTSYRQTWYLLHTVPDQTTHEVLKTRRKEKKTRLATDRGKSKFDRSRVCPECGLPVFIRDENNNYIDKTTGKDREICQHTASIKLRDAMKKRITEKRKKKPTKNKDPMRYKK